MQSSSENHLFLCASGPSPRDLTSCDEAQLGADDSPGLDFEGWLQLHSTSSVTESGRADIDLVATPSSMGIADLLCFSSLQPEISQEDGEMCEISTPSLLGLVDGGTVGIGDDDS